MNKYQEALDYIESIVIDEDVLRIFDSPNYPPLIKNHIKLLQKLIDEYNELKLLLEEYNIDDSNIREMLMIANIYKDKKTPKKPLIIKYKNSEHYFCLNCEKHRFGILDYGEYKNEWRKGSELTPYCPNCGEEIDLGDEDVC